MIEVIQSYRFDPTGTNSQVILDANQLMALSIWMAHAIGNKDIKPLWFTNMGKFAWREGYVVKFKNIKGAAGEDTQINILDAINKLGIIVPNTSLRIITPTFRNSSPSSLYPVTVKGKDKILGWWDEKHSLLPVGLRIWKEMDVWYAFEGQQVGATPINFAYKFDDLTTGTI